MGQRIAPVTCIAFHPVQVDLFSRPSSIWISSLFSPLSLFFLVFFTDFLCHTCSKLIWLSTRLMSVYCMLLCCSHCPNWEKNSQFTLFLTQQIFTLSRYLFVPRRILKVFVCPLSWCMCVWGGGSTMTAANHYDRRHNLVKFVKQCRLLKNMPFFTFWLLWPSWYSLWAFVAVIVCGCVT